MRADIRRIFTSDLGTITQYWCREEPGMWSGAECSDRYEISYTSAGDYTYRAGGRSHEIDCNALLLTTPSVEYRVAHPHRVSDAGSILSVSERLLADALRECWRRDGHIDRSSLSDKQLFPRPVVRATPQLDLLHSALVRSIGASPGNCSIRTDSILVEFVHELYRHLDGGANDSPPERRLRERHLETIERAKAHVLENYTEDVGLSDVARAAFVSEFHFSRLFKALTGSSPYRYLIDVRLQSAALLLLHTRLSITEVCFASGFASFPHFITEFRRAYGASPRRFRTAPPRNSKIPKDRQLRTR